MVHMNPMNVAIQGDGLTVALDAIADDGSSLCGHVQAIDSASFRRGGNWKPNINDDLYFFRKTLGEYPPWWETNDPALPRVKITRDDDGNFSVAIEVE